MGLCERISIDKVCCLIVLLCLFLIDWVFVCLFVCCCCCFCFLLLYLSHTSSTLIFPPSVSDVIEFFVPITVVPYYWYIFMKSEITMTFKHVFPMIVSSAMFVHGKWKRKKEKKREKRKKNCIEWNRI